MGQSAGKGLGTGYQKRAKARASAQKASSDVMTKYDKNGSGTLTRDEVQALGNDLLNQWTPLVGGLDEADYDEIMRCGGKNVKLDIKENELPDALSIMMCIKEHNRQLVELFQRYDTDNSGMLDEDQLASLLAEVNDGIPVKPSDVSYILEQCEPRMSKHPIPLTELRAAIGCWYVLANIQPGDHIKETFRLWDKEGNGVISKDELVSAMTAISPHHSKENWEKLFHSIDKTNTGVIEFEEFVDWILSGDNEDAAVACDVHKLPEKSTFKP